MKPDGVRARALLRVPNPALPGGGGGGDRLGLVPAAGSARIGVLESTDGEGTRAFRGMGAGWPDLSLSDPTPHPVTSMECWTQRWGGGCEGIAPQPSELCSDALSRGEAGREPRE